MFLLKKQTKRSLDDEIQHVLDSLSKLPPESEQYQIAVGNLEVLHEARSHKKAWFVEPELIVGAVTNLAGIVVILKYEELRVISSKALQFVLKGRL